MRRWIWLWALVVMGCGGSGSGKLPDPGRPFEFEEVYPESKLVGHAEYDGQTLEFLAIETVEGLAVVVQQQAPVGSVDVWTRLQAARPESVTPAELWRHVTGGEDVPEELALHHQEQAEREGRSPEYLPTEDAPAPLVTAKAADANVVKASFFPRISTTQCWTQIIMKRGFNQSTVAGGFYPQGIPAKHACTGPGSVSGQSTLFRSGDVNHIAACPTALNDSGRWRVGAFNDGKSKTASGGFFPQVRSCQGFGDPFTTGNWTCNIQSELHDGFFVVTDLDSTSLHRVGMGVANVLPAGTQEYVFYFGVGKLVAGAPVANLGTCSL